MGQDPGAMGRVNLNLMKRQTINKTREPRDQTRLAAIEMVFTPEECSETDRTAQSTILAHAPSSVGRVRAHDALVILTSAAS